MVADEVEFNGTVYRRYPESPHLNHRKYYCAHGSRWLHREIWKHHRGAIPDGWEIHHRDRNSLNNELENLECVPAELHRAEHSNDVRSDPERLAKVRENIARAGLAARAWHGSPAGLAWHREHGKAVWANREPIERSCEQCGAGFDCITRRPSDRFCSNNCKSAFRRASGVDNVERICANCGQSFVINRYSRSVNCSRPCGVQWRKRKR